MDYWKECVTEALEDAKLTATDEQISTITSWVEGAHDNYGMAHGHDCIPNPLTAEIESLRSKLKAEEQKVHCKECGGRGRITENFGTRSSNSECWKCRGEGRHKP